MTTGRPTNWDQRSEANLKSALNVSCTQRGSRWCDFSLFSSTTSLWGSPVKTSHLATYHLTDSSDNKSQLSLTAVVGLVAASSVVIWLYFTVYPLGPLLAWFAASGLVALIGRRLRNRTCYDVCSGMFVLGVLAMPYVVMEGHSVSPYRLERVKLGATTAEVEAALGAPSSIAPDASGDEWLYAGPTWCHVRISFDANGTVDDIIHDH